MPSVRSDLDRPARPAEPGRPEPIAVVGMALRFPGDNDRPSKLAEFLRAGRSGVRPLPTDRWDAERFGPQAGTGDGRIRTVAGGFLDRIAEFDANFFGISPREANHVDPQQRVLLETAWLALEDANIDPTPLRHGDGGIYIGASSIDYALETESLSYDQLDGFLATGITGYPMSGRLSYFLGWRGPSVNVDTACASSLTAAHLAVTGLRRGECSIALVGGVNLIHHPRTLVMFSANNMLAPDGRCKAFDEAADGYGRAEGCGVLVLKTLSAAHRDGDRILALLTGTAIGQDGESAGLTAPNGSAQERVIRAALQDAAALPDEISYVEAHGTGTPLGDPIELGSINAVFGSSHSAERPIWVGSLKSNLSHMEPAAGVGGIIKTILQLREGVIFPHRHERLSSRVPWDRYAIAIPTSCVPWQAETRRAVVNGFGFAGAIGVVVLEQAPVEEQAELPESAGPQLLVLSARSKAVLPAQLATYQSYLSQHQDVPLAAICRTAAVGRSAFGHRVAEVGRTHGELASELAAAAQRVSRQPRRRNVRKTAFLFAGAGPQHPAWERRCTSGNRTSPPGWTSATSCSVPTWDGRSRRSCLARRQIRR